MIVAERESGFEQAHREATTASVREIATLLHKVLSRRLTAYIAGVRDAKTVTRWVNGEVTEIRDHDVERRLRIAYEIVRLLLIEESASTVRAWFIGLDPYLDDVSPAEVIREGRLQEALAAARAAIASQATAEALALAGAWADLDWDDAVAALDRIRHESEPTPPIEIV